MTEQRMCLDTFLRLRRSLATSTLYAAVSILAEFFYFTGKQFPVKLKRDLVERPRFADELASTTVVVKSEAVTTAATEEQQ